MDEPNGSELDPLQAVFRLLLELAAIVGWGIVGWHVTGGIWRWGAMLLLPIAAAAVWGTFRVPGDHSANGGAPVAVPGFARLVIELVVLLGAAALTAVTWRPVPGLILGGLIVLHYTTTITRVRWLLARHPAA